eukprot:m.768 g.768  ORF g.768 m.768 type:complete len:212 (+) comp4821_c0_seq1:169-804(+)
MMATEWATLVDTKMSYLSENVRVADTLLNAMMAVKLIDYNEKETIEKTPGPNSARVSKLIGIARFKGPDSFSKFCDGLVRAKMEWVVKELRVRKDREEQVEKTDLFHSKALSALVTDQQIKDLKFEVFGKNDELVDFGMKLLGYSYNKSKLQIDGLKSVDVNFEELVQKWKKQEPCPTVEKLLNVFAKLDRGGVASRILIGDGCFAQFGQP